MARRRTVEEERERLAAMRQFEKECGAVGLFGGVDEAGRGPLAGPVTAACVILPPDCEILWLNDSKQLTPVRRELLFDEICSQAISFGVGMADAAFIDREGILPATYRAMREALSQMDPPPEFLLNDAVTIPGIDLPQRPIIRGDAQSLSIAAASILAKVTRDRYMVTVADPLYPEYGFARHKGYGTRQHREAIRIYGPCPLHRRTFLKKILREEHD